MDKSRVEDQRSHKKETIFVGCNSDLLHTLITVAKRHIFQSRCKEERPNMNVYHASILLLMKTELYIARKNNKKHKLFEKWEAVQQYLS